jgi:REP element-mobilizing transposase RayT
VIEEYSFPGSAWERTVREAPPRKTQQKTPLLRIAEMSRTRYKIYDNAYPHFLTCTVVGWTPVFTRPETVEIVLDSWKYLQRNSGLDIFGFVILDNHLHFIAATEDLSDALKRFKSYTARKVVDLLEARNAQHLLRHLNFYKLNHKKDQEFQLWQEGSHPQIIESDEVMWQKLEYMHENPVKRGYVDDPLHWRYSSARNYAGQTGLIEVTTSW